MDITLNCNLSLSKKLRALIGNSETSIRILSGILQDGKAQADITLSVDSISKKDLAELINKETSIMLTPTGVSETVVAGDDGVTNIFAEGIDPDAGPRTAVNRLAATKPPEKYQAAYAIKTQEEVVEEMPQNFKVVKNNKFQKFITDFESLMDAVHAAEAKSYNVDVDSIKDPRQRALALEAKEKAEAIDYPAYVVNEKYANLTLNDLGVNLKKNGPLNLNNISAKRIAASKELPAMLRAGYLKFISPDEIQEYMQRAAKEADVGGYEVFGGKSGSARAFAHSERVNAGEDADEAGEINLAEGELTEQEQLVRVYQTGKTSASAKEELTGSRISQHGSMPSPSRPVIQTKDNPNIKRIRKTGIEYN